MEGSRLEVGVDSDCWDWGADEVLGHVSEGSLASRTLPLLACVLDGLPGPPPRLTQAGEVSQTRCSSPPSIQGCTRAEHQPVRPHPAGFPPCRK